MILTDQETKFDLLNNEAIAATIVNLFRKRPNTPVTIGVHGDWGIGKSSVLEMIEQILRSEKSVVYLKFNAWRFQGFEDAKIALIEGIVNGLIEARPALKKTTEAVKNILARIDWMKAAKILGGLACTAWTLHTGDHLSPIIMMLQGMISDPTKQLTKENAQAILEDLSSVVKSKETSRSPEEVRQFQECFDKLLVEAKIDQLVVLIDDLDRCLPSTAIETLEAIRLFVLTSKTAFVIAADESMIEYSVRKHFPELPETTGPLSYARNYLEKLIQVPFRIPTLGITETRVFVTLLLIGAELGEEDPKFIKLVKRARDLLKRPWMNQVLNNTVVKEELGNLTDNVQSALILSEQIGTILADGTQGNPRQIKRFLNSLILRRQIANERGFGDEISVSILAKLMLAERFQRRLFDQLAIAISQSPTGKCEELETIETADVNEKMDTNSIGKSPCLEEWLALETVRDWAKISPPLADIDLRPYFFITRDNRGYLGCISVLGPLEEIAKKLMGPQIAVQALAPDIKLLKPIEFEKLFETIRGRIVSADRFDTVPAGVAGLCVLVKAHPALMSSLIELLETLPKEKLGPWVVAGWNELFSGTESESRYNKLLETWSQYFGNKALSAAANGAIKVRKGVH